MKSITYTYDQFVQIVTQLNRIQVTGLDQARTLTMVGMLLDEGVQSEIPDENADSRNGDDGQDEGKGDTGDDTEGHC